MRGSGSARRGGAEALFYRARSAWIHCGVQEGRAVKSVKLGPFMAVDGGVTGETGAALIRGLNAHNVGGNGDGFTAVVELLMRIHGNQAWRRLEKKMGRKEKGAAGPRGSGGEEAIGWGRVRGEREGVEQAGRVKQAEAGGARVNSNRPRRFRPKRVNRYFN